MKYLKSFRNVLVGLALSALASVVCAGGEDNTKSRKSPNLIFDISGVAVNGLVQRIVDKTDPIDDIVQDTPVHGIGRTVGVVQVELIPDEREAVAEVSLQGQIYSRTIGTRPFVYIYSSAVTSLDVRHRIVVDAKGIRTVPGRTHAEASIVLDDVCSREEPDYLAMRFARKGFEKYKHLAEAESACKAAAQASAALQEELTAPLKSASKAAGTGLIEVKGAGLNLESLHFKTTATKIQANLRIATRQKPPGQPPELPADTDFGLRIHESLVNELAWTALAGKSFPLSGLGKFYDETTFGLLRDGRKDGVRKTALQHLTKLIGDLGTKPVAITLSRKDPLTVAFTNQGFNVEIHVAAVHQGDVDFAGMRVRADYQLENTREGVHAVRKGPLRFEASDEHGPTKKLKAQPASFLIAREFLFAEVMQERISLVSVQLPESMGKLRLQAPRSGADNGWFALVWALATLEK